MLNTVSLLQIVIHMIFLSSLSPLLSPFLPAFTDHQWLHRAVLRLNINEQMECEVSFCSDKPQNVKATMSLQVQDNLYNNTVIQVTGEAYQEIVSLDNISRLSPEMTREYDEKGTVGKESWIGRNGKYCMRIMFYSTPALVTLAVIL